MDQESARTVSEIQAIRTRLDDEFDALAATLPPRDEVVRKLVVSALAGAAVVLTVWYLAHRFRVRGEEKRLKRLVREAVREAGTDL